MGLTLRIAEEGDEKSARRGTTLRRKKSGDFGYPGAKRACLS